VEGTQLGIVVAADLGREISATTQHRVTMLGERLVGGVGPGAALESGAQPRERHDLVGIGEAPGLPDERRDPRGQVVAQAGDGREPRARAELAIELGDPFPQCLLAPLLGFQEIEILVSPAAAGRRSTG
jgi:hypothetical protein